MFYVPNQEHHNTKGHSQVLLALDACICLYTPWANKKRATLLFYIFDNY